MKKSIFKYFIELITIIVGVVIAFAFTKYGESLNKDQTEKEVVNQIYFELKDNLSDLENDFIVHRTALVSHLNVMKFLEGNGEVNDSLIMDFYWMTKDEYIFPNVSGYENLKSLGINLIKDDSLRNLITLVYNHNFPRLTKNNSIKPDINEYFSPFFSTHFRVNRDTSLKYVITLKDSIQVTYPRDIALGVKQVIGYVPMDKDKLLQNEEFRFLVNEAVDFRMYKFQFYRRCIENVNKALERIEEKYIAK